MLSVALSSLRRRTSSFAATFLAMFLGATILMTFAAMLDTSAGDGVDAVTENTLVTMASVVGGWGMLIVVFAVVSTLTLTIRQRGREMALLKSVGATPAQIGRMIVGEAAVVSVAAALAAVLPAMLGGRLLFEVLQDTGQVPAAVSYAFGPVALSMGLGITFAAATIAAVVSARRATRMRAKDALVDAAVEAPRLSRKRVVAGWLFLLAGISCGVVSATVFHGKGIDAMAVGGQAAILCSIGLALFAPVLIRAVTAVLAVPLQGFGGVSGYLAVLNVRQRTQQMAGALVPIILFTGIATGTLYLQLIENSAPGAGDSTTSAADVKAIETLNLVVVGMIAVFAAIMVVNTLVAATTYRRQEFGQQRLVGSTPPQVLRMVTLEGIALALTGVLAGSVAAVSGVIGYSISRTDRILPDSGIAVYLGIVAIAVALTMAASIGAARRAIRPPAVEAVAA